MNILKFSAFEALTPSEFRPYMEIWQKNPNLRERYKSMFQSFKEKYDGDRKSYRIYLPLIERDSVSEVESEIDKFLTGKGWELVDYMDGKARFGNSKNTKRIGQVLGQLERRAEGEEKEYIKKITKLYNEDPIKKQGKGSKYLVCISRHPYDVAGADTNRKWENCMTIGVGQNYKYLMHDVREGSLVAYLINKDDKNIKDPVANCAIKPYINSTDKSDIILLRDLKTYPQPYPDFEKTVSSFLDEVNGGKEGVYCLNPKLYKDTIGSSNSYINIKELTPEYVTKIASVYKIKGIKINTDLSIDVEGDVDLSDMNLKKLPLKFNNVSGSFWVTNNELETLEGSPQWVGGDYFVYGNNLKNLEGGPKVVIGEYSAQSNNINSTDGFPIEVGDFDISYNPDIKDISQKDIEVNIRGKFINKW